MKKPRKISFESDGKQIDADLRQLCQTAIKKGAWDVKSLTRQDIIFTEPEKNSDYKSASSPIIYEKDDLTASLKIFENAVFFSVKTPPDMADPGSGPIKTLKTRQTMLKVYSICAGIEADAFYMGRVMSTGFAWGNCRAVFCHNQKRCWALVTGRVCLHPYKARPSMSAAGIDAVKMAKNLGWNFSDDEYGPLFAGIVFV